MATLYDLGSQYNQLLDMLESGEYTLDDLRDTIEMIDDEFDEKAVKVALVRNMEQAEIAKIDEEIKRLNDLKNSHDSNINRLEKYLFNQMTAVGKTSIKSPLVNINIKTNPESVNTDDPRWGENGKDFVLWAQKNNRDDLLKYGKPTPKLSAIKDAIKSGQDIPASLHRKTKLNIR